MSSQSSQEFESFLPVYDVIPEDWEEAREILVEYFKKVSNAVNVRTIGWLLDEELLSGQSFIPGVTIPGNNPGQFRQVLRKVIDTGALVVGTQMVAHGITFDDRFTLIDLWVAATNSGTKMAQVITGNDVIMDATNLNITSTSAYDRSFAFVEYLQEL